ncbi:uncharacterized protein PAF06_004233 [Gastrophryne carolinensis]
MRRQPRSSLRGGDVTMWNVTSDEEVINEHEEPESTYSLEDVPFRKHLFFVGTPKRIQEITKEEKFLQTEDIQLPAALQLDRILHSKKIPRSSNPEPRNSFLTPPSNYSRHQGTKGPPRDSNNNSKLKIKDGGSSTRWPQKTLTNQPKVCLSRDPEDVPHP